jgi:hypothetical protein
MSARSQLIKSELQFLAKKFLAICTGLISLLLSLLKASTATLDNISKRITIEDRCFSISLAFFT